MSRYSVQPLDSQRFANFVAPLDCYICGLGNSHDSERCRHCGAPNALARHAVSEKQRPKLVAALGAESTGKSTYLGMLIELLSRPTDDMKINARGVFSIGIQQETMSAFRHNRFPKPTSANSADWNWLHCQVQARRRKWNEIIMPDLSGKAVHDELNDDVPFPVVQSLLHKSEGAILFVDAAQIATGRHDQDFFTMKVINFMCGMKGDPRNAWPNRPVAIVCSKADQQESCFDDPREFVREFAPQLWGLVTTRLKRYEFFAASVAGSCAYANELGKRNAVPLRIEPRGIIEPFKWLSAEMK